MIAECLIFLATVLPNGMNETHMIEQHRSCDKNVPQSMQQYAEHYVEFFEEENIPVAVRIGWCESRGREAVVRKDNKDSGLMQFVSWTWNWVAEKYDMPMWNSYQVMYNDKPYTEEKVSLTSAGFSMQKAQLTAYYNIKMASHLAEDIYGKTQWNDWSSSKWCWGNEKKWRQLWKSEEG